ncbi:MAG: PilZ domain-containing protein [Gammaproteobacteria bacterium]|nr:PilZ domain-containing protein [Gammaproteobacteria bacterium]
MDNLAEKPLNDYVIIQRSQQRWNLVHHLRVLKAENNELLGHLVDVTTEGMMLISEQAIPLQCTFNLRMEIPVDDDTVPQMIALTAQSLWTKKDVNPTFHDTGFRLIDPSRRAINAISRLIDELKSEN